MKWQHMPHCIGTYKIERQKMIDPTDYTPFDSEPIVENEVRELRERFERNDIVGFYLENDEGFYINNGN